MSATKPESAEDILEQAKDELTTAKKNIELTRDKTKHEWKDFDSQTFRANVHNFMFAAQISVRNAEVLIAQAQQRLKERDAELGAQEWESVKVLSGHRIALPQWVCERLDIGIGNYIRVKVKGSWEIGRPVIIIEPVKIQPLSEESTAP